jgi:hypothetical protein
MLPAPDSRRITNRIERSAREANSLIVNPAASRIERTRDPNAASGDARENPSPGSVPGQSGNWLSYGDDGYSLHCSSVLE